MLPKETIKNVILSQREFLDSSEQGILREKSKEIKIEDSLH